MNDADSTITAAFFVAEEGTLSSLRGLQETIGRFGLFGVLYADRGSHYWTTTGAGKLDKTNPTQVRRALIQLGIELILAYPPEARGGRSGCSARCRDGCRRSCAARASPKRRVTSLEVV